MGQVSRQRVRIRNAADGGVFYWLAKLYAFAVLAEVPTDDVEPSPYPLPIAHRGRPDVAEPGLPQDEVLENAPEQRAGCFRVPRVVEG